MDKAWIQRGSIELYDRTLSSNKTMHTGINVGWSSIISWDIYIDKQPELVLCRAEKTSTVHHPENADSILRDARKLIEHESFAPQIKHERRMLISLSSKESHWRLPIKLQF